MAALIRQALREGEGSVLAFLPGEAEIRRTADVLMQSSLPDDVEVRPLYGALSWKDQNAAVAPSPPGMRKVVLATTIAETSLTIEGVRIVVDCGLKRVSRFDAARGMSQLVTVSVSRASAEQRRGRAGRLGPGACYRLWTEAEDRALVAYDAPEMQLADLSPLALDLANWGVADPLSLSWLTPPPTATFQQGVDLLKSLGALDASARITAEGREMAALPLHPRLAHLVHRGIEMSAGATACDLAALLAERDFLIGTRDPDLRTRIDILARDQDAREAVRVNRGGLERVRASAKQIRAIAKVREADRSSAATGVLTALAYPDRIAHPAKCWRLPASRGRHAFGRAADRPISSCLNRLRRGASPLCRISQRAGPPCSPNPCRPNLPANLIERWPANDTLRRHELFFARLPGVARQRRGRSVAGGSLQG